MIFRPQILNYVRNFGTPRRVISDGAVNSFDMYQLALGRLLQVKLYQALIHYPVSPDSNGMTESTVLWRCMNDNKFFKRYRFMSVATGNSDFQELVTGANLENWDQQEILLDPAVYKHLSGEVVSTSAIPNHVING